MKDTPTIDLNKVSINLLIRAPSLLEKTDAMLVSVLHIIEDLNLDAVKLIKMAVLLRTLRRKRRFYKELVALYQSMGIDGERVESWKRKSNRRLQGYKEKSEKDLMSFEEKFNL